LNQPQLTRAVSVVLRVSIFRAMAHPTQSHKFEKAHKAARFQHRITDEAVFGNLYLLS
jgi:hypothetical protein